MKIRTTIILLTLLIASSVMALPNPASVNCVNVGGELKLEHNSKGVIGICYFPDGKQCEEWALFRGKCPVGGVDVSNATVAERNCLILGGKYDQRQALCSLIQ